VWVCVCVCVCPVWITRVTNGYSGPKDRRVQLRGLGDAARRTRMGRGDAVIINDIHTWSNVVRLGREEVFFTVLFSFPPPAPLRVKNHISRYAFPSVPNTHTLRVCAPHARPTSRNFNAFADFRPAPRRDERSGLRRISGIRYVMSVTTSLLFTSDLLFLLFFRTIFTTIKISRTIRIGPLADPRHACTLLRARERQCDGVSRLPRPQLNRW